MRLDIRLPIGFLFATLGLVLVWYGIFGSHAVYARSFGINVNLEWGIVLIVFGAAMLALARRTRSR